MLMVNPKGETWNISNIKINEDGRPVDPGYWVPIDDIHKPWLLVDPDTSEVVMGTKHWLVAFLVGWLLKLQLVERVEWSDVENQRWETVCK